MPFAVCVNKGPSSRSDSGPTNARRSHRPRHPSGCSQRASVAPRRLLETPSLARVGVHDRRRKLQVAKCIRWRTHEQAAHRPANRSLLRTRREASQNKALLRRGSPRFPSHQNAVNPWHKRFTRHASGPILEDRAAWNAPRSSGREGDTQALTRGGRDEDNAALYKGNTRANELCKPRQGVAFLAAAKHEHRLAGEVLRSRPGLDILHAAVVHVGPALGDDPPGVKARTLLKATVRGGTLAETTVQASASETLSQVSPIFRAA